MGCPCVLMSPRSLAFPQSTTQWVSAKVSVSAVLRPAMRARECLKVPGTQGNHSIQSPGSSGEGAPGPAMAQAWGLAKTEVTGAAGPRCKNEETWRR